MSFTLRKHQIETVEVCREILEGKPVREIVLSVTPGGGKSFVPVIIADNLIPAVAEKICWVVPRNSLKYQGEDEFCDPHWQTTKRIRAADNGDDLSRGLDGYVTTYQAVGQNPECHIKEFWRHKYILFLDEFHHISEGSEWHRAVKWLVDSAALVILASGTLSRGDGQRIAFIDYDHGEPVLKNTVTRRVITYSRSAAIADGAILPIRFNLVDGESEWEEIDGHRSTSALSGEESAKALFTALRTGFADYLLDAALREYAEISYSYTETKMLVVAPNIEIAKTYPVSSKANITDMPEPEPQIELPPCSPSEAEKILRKHINGIITEFLDRQHHGNKQAHQKMLYRRMRLICEKPVKDMNQEELQAVWLWVRKEYGGDY